MRLRHTSHCTVRLPQVDSCSARCRQGSDSSQYMHATDRPVHSVVTCTVYASLDTGSPHRSHGWAVCVSCSCFNASAAEVARNLQDGKWEQCVCWPRSMSAARTTSRHSSQKRLLRLQKARCMRSDASGTREWQLAHSTPSPAGTGGPAASVAPAPSPTPEPSTAPGAGGAAAAGTLAAEMVTVMGPP
jgi:hypothetical protein